MMRSERAFTLIEILVVVGIIALLVAILLPTLSEARRQSQAIRCATNLRTSGMGVKYYAQADAERYPSGGWWAEVSRVYIQKLHSGKINASEEGNTSNELVDQDVAFYYCPNDPIRHPTYNVRQMVNGRLVRTKYDISYTMNGYIGKHKLSAVKHPGATVMLTDGGNDGAHRLEELEWDFDDMTDPSGNGAVLEVHHKTGNNFLFADMHHEYKKILNRDPCRSLNFDERKNHVTRQGIPSFPRHWTANGRDP